VPGGLGGLPGPAPPFGQWDASSILGSRGVPSLEGTGLARDLCARGSWAVLLNSRGPASVITRCPVTRWR
jgi:hypothetical protein